MSNIMESLSTAQPADIPGITHHALLFGLIAQEILLKVGEEKGGKALRKAVRRYAEQRGKRMADRASRWGYRPDTFAFLVFGEWQAMPGEVEVQATNGSEGYTIQVIQCPWYAAWQANNLENAGKYYCMEVDESLARGFNPEVKLETRHIRPLEGIACEFVYHDVYLKGIHRWRYQFAKRFYPGKHAVMPWEYHLGHLYKTIREILIEEAGEEAESAVQTSLDQFSARFGKDLTQKIIDYQETDFNRLP